MPDSPVKYALLYRGHREWRTTVRTQEEIACGALEDTTLSEPFEEASREFEALLKRYWGVDGPLLWDEFKPGWWGVDLVPAGALRGAGETSD